MPQAILNNPDLWRDRFPKPAPDGHKYDRGHSVILGADQHTGATRLAAEACSRIGSGLVTVHSSTRADLYRQVLPADIMIADGRLDEINRASVVLAGPGGCSEHQAKLVSKAAGKLPVVLDADAIRLASHIDGQAILTPHAGEFERYIGSLESDRIATTGNAARETGAIIVLKGAETLIADPDGRYVRNMEASPYLAKAGSGDVLAGMITGLVAQGMPLFDAACAGVWLHGHAAKQIGAGLIPQDISAALPGLLHKLLDT